MLAHENSELRDASCNAIEYGLETGSEMLFGVAISLLEQLADSDNSFTARALEIVSACCAEQYSAEERSTFKVFLEATKVRREAAQQSFHEKLGEVMIVVENVGFQIEL
jgi:hypothetical protein